MAKYASPTPIAPKLAEPRRTATDDELASEPEWTRLDIANDLGGIEVHGADIRECRIVGSTFSRAGMSRARIIDTAFIDCDLSGVDLEDSVLTRVELRNCRLSGMILNAAKLRDVSITECKADSVSMRMLTAERLTCSNTMLTSADLTRAKLELCRFFDCDTTRVEISGATFADVRLHGSDLSGLRGILSMRNVAIDPVQMHAISLALLAAHSITIDDEREPGAPS